MYIYVEIYLIHNLLEITKDHIKEAKFCKHCQIKYIKT